MIRIIQTLVLLGLTIALLQINVPTASSQGNCENSNLVPSRLQEGATARVIYDSDGIGVVFRDNPGKEQSGSRVIRALPEGSILSIIQGPICIDGNVWWQVDLPTGEQGWVAEGNATDYFVEPYIVSTYIVKSDPANPRVLMRVRVDVNGEVSFLETVNVPGDDPVPAGELWQQPDLDAANNALADRRANCPEVLSGTPWEDVSTAAEVIVPEGDFDYYLSPDGGKIFLIRHRVLPIPACNSTPGKYYGISTAHLILNENINDLFPYSQHSGARSKNNCFSPSVDHVAWTTYLSQVVWSPDSDTVVFTARYLDQDDGGRPCAYYYTYMIDVFSGQITPIDEGRRVAWGEGGTRLYYFAESTDNGYNITNTEFWQLESGEWTRIALPDTAQPLPGVFDSTGLLLPWTEDGRQALFCTGPINCPTVFSFDILARQPSLAVELPDIFQPFEIKSVHYVAGNTRLLWLTQNGDTFIQALQGIDAGNWGGVSLDQFAAPARVSNVQIMPGGIFVLMQLENDEYGLLNTITREVKRVEINPAELTESTDTAESENDEQ